MTSESYDQPDGTPTTKLGAATLGAAVATVLIVGAAWLFGVEPPPPGFEGGLATIFTFVFGYFIRERRAPTPPTEPFRLDGQGGWAGVRPTLWMVLVIVAIWAVIFWISL